MPQTPPTVQSLAAALIHSFEGCKLTAYQDSGGIWTIGYGHTGPDVHAGLVWTQQQADDAFAKDAGPLFSMVADKPMIAAAALVSFGFNCGQGALHRVLVGDSQMLDFVKDAKKNVLPGLVARRTVENQLVMASS